MSELESGWNDELDPLVNPDETDAPPDPGHAEVEDDGVAEREGLREAGGEDVEAQGQVAAVNTAARLLGGLGSAAKAAGSLSLQGVGIARRYPRGILAAGLSAALLGGVLVLRPGKGGGAQPDSPPQNKGESTRTSAGRKADDPASVPTPDTGKPSESVAGPSALDRKDDEPSPAPDAGKPPESVTGPASPPTLADEPEKEKTAAAASPPVDRIDELIGEANEPASPKKPGDPPAVASAVPAPAPKPASSPAAGELVTLTGGEIDSGLPPVDAPAPALSEPAHPSSSGGATLPDGNGLADLGSPPGLESGPVPAPASGPSGRQPPVVALPAPVELAAADVKPGTPPPAEVKPGTPPPAEVKPGTPPPAEAKPSSPSPTAASPASSSPPAKDAKHEPGAEPVAPIPAPGPGKADAPKQEPPKKVEEKNGKPAVPLVGAALPAAALAVSTAVKPSPAVPAPVVPAPAPAPGAAKPGTPEPAPAALAHPSEPAPASNPGLAPAPAPTHGLEPEATAVHSPGQAPAPASAPASLPSGGPPPTPPAHAAAAVVAPVAVPALGGLLQQKPTGDPAPASAKVGQGEPSASPPSSPNNREPEVGKGAGLSAAPVAPAPTHADSPAPANLPQSEEVPPKILTEDDLTKQGWVPIKRSGGEATRDLQREMAGLDEGSPIDPGAHADKEQNFEYEAPPLPKGLPAAAAVAAKSRSSTRTAAAQAEGKTETVLHTVRANENFWTISRAYYNSGRFYRALWKANAAEVPVIDKLYKGTVIKIPPEEDLDVAYIDPPSAVTRTAKAGTDTGAGRARQDPQIDRSEARTGSRSDGVPIRRARKADVDLDLPDSAQDADVSGDDKPVASNSRRSSTARRGSRDDMDPEPRSRASGERPIYKVRPNDTLRTIARDTLGDSRRAGEILELNRDIVDDPARLITGQILELPEDARPARSRRR